MYWIVTPRLMFHARTQCYDKEVDVSYLQHQVAAEVLMACIIDTHRLVAQETIHPFTRQCWKLLYEAPRTTMERLWHALRKLLPTAGNSKKMFLVSTLPRDSRQQNHHQDTHVISQADGDHGTKHFRRISWKKEEKLCKKKMFYIIYEAMEV